MTIRIKKDGIEGDVWVNENGDIASIIYCKNNHVLAELTSAMLNDAIGNALLVFAKDSPRTLGPKKLGG